MSLAPQASRLDKILAALRTLASRLRRAPTRPVRWPRPRPEHLLLGLGVVALVMAFDEPIARFAITLPRPIVAAAKVVTDLGTSLYMFVVSAAVALAAILARGRGRGRRADAGLRAMAERATYVFATVALAGVTAQIVKHIVGRARPRFIDTLGPHHFEFIALQANQNSFPSGHSANAFAAAMALGILWPRTRPWLLGAATIVAVSRIAVRAHYPSDTLAGAVLGYGCAIATGLFFAGRGLALRQTARGLVARGSGTVGVALRSILAPPRRAA